MYLIGHIVYQGEASTGKSHNTCISKTKVPCKAQYWNTVFHEHIKQLLDEVEHDIRNDQNRGLCYLLKPKAGADNKDMRF